MSKFSEFLFLLLLSYTTDTCRAQLSSGEPLILATKNLLATTEAAIQTVNIEGVTAQTRIKEIVSILRHNATTIRGRIDDVVNDTLTVFQAKIDSLAMNGNYVSSSDCALPSTAVKSAGAKVLMEANSCVSNTMESIERELNDTYSAIGSILSRINSDRSLAETCVADYDKTDMGLLNAIVTALCVSQAKERILSAIKDELLTRNDAAFLDVLYTDSLSRLTRCDDSKSISSFVTKTDFIYDQIMTCISNSQMVQAVN